MSARLVSLFDVDNTLIDNDRIAADLRLFLQHSVGAERAEGYVVVDDKVRLLAAFKRQWRERVVTVWPRQGHYAHAPDVDRWPRPDVTIERIGELATMDLAGRLGAARAREGT